MSLLEAIAAEMRRSGRHGERKRDPLRGVPGHRPPGPVTVTVKGPGDWPSGVVPARRLPPGAFADEGGGWRDACS